MDNGGDARGYSYTVPPEALAFLEDVKDIHYASTLPSAVRGNHYHTDKEEVIIVVYSDGWLLGWDEGEGTSVNERAFEGAGAVCLEVERYASHAIKNTGASPLYITGLSNAAYAPTHTIPRPVL